MYTVCRLCPTRAAVEAFVRDWRAYLVPGALDDASTYQVQSGGLWVRLWVRR